MFKILESCLICYYNTIFRKSAYIMVESDKDMLQIYVERHFKYIFLVFLLAVRLTTVAPTLSLPAPDSQIQASFCSVI